MVRHLLRFLPLVRRPHLRWGSLPTLLLALSGCARDPPTWPPPHVGEETDFSILLGRPALQVDILFLIDNSPSMASKQTVLAQNLPKMIQALQWLPDGLPDVHIGVASSDMGAGTQPAGANWRYLGDRGLLWGNDPSPGAIATVAGAATDGCGLDPGARWIEDIQDPYGFGRERNYTGELADVFSCLASAVGVNGSSYPHPLQALRVALNPQAGINDANVGFVRSKAYLFIVLIADEDDCSAAPDDTIDNGMFQAVTPGDTSRLRCAARGHICNGQPIPDYDPATGYTGQGFAANFADCAAKDQLDPSQPDYAYLPLIRVQDTIDSVSAVKARPEEQILVSGVIGWPRYFYPPDVQPTDLYQIGKDSTAPSPQDTLWDYLPICEGPWNAPAGGNTYKAYGGLRLKQFIDAYKEGSDVNTFSICNPDFMAAMTQIGNSTLMPRKVGCIESPLIDADPSTPETQPECQAILKISCETLGQADCLSSGYRETLLPECKDPVSGLPLNPADPQPDSVPDDNRPCWYLYYDTTATTGCPDSFKGQRIAVSLNTGQMAPPGSLLTVACLTCPNSDQQCAGGSQ